MTPSRMNTASSDPAATACCFASTAPRRLTVLRSQRDQRMSGYVTAVAPASRCAWFGVNGDADRKTVGGVVAAGK